MRLRLMIFAVYVVSRQNVPPPGVDVLCTATVVHVHDAQQAIDDL